jgi:hypothetical protein
MDVAQRVWSLKARSSRRGRVRDEHHAVNLIGVETAGFLSLATELWLHP